MNEITTARMLLTTAALAAVAALFAGGANARLMDVDGGTASGRRHLPSSAAADDPVPEPRDRRRRVPVERSADELSGVHAALQR